MTINQNDIIEIYCKVRRTVAKDERFYAVPGAKDYAVSTYCRVLQRKHGDWYEVLKPIGYDYYIRFDSDVKKQRICINVLAARVFFPHIRGGYLETAHQYNGWQAWKVENMHLCVGGNMLIEAIRAKIERREANYSDEYKHHQFINRLETDSINKYLNSVYCNMKSRATNKKTKKRFPAYKDTMISEEWRDNPTSFKQWFLNNQYYYPGKLEIDKDLLNFGRTNEYSSENCCLLPRYINDMFTKGKSELGYTITKLTRKDGSVKYQIPGNAFGGGNPNKVFDNYCDALQYGRNRKAAYISKVVNAERERGFIPDYILNRMLEWATLIKFGSIKVLEPASDTILKESA